MVCCSDMVCCLVVVVEGGKAAGEGQQAILSSGGRISYPTCLTRPLYRLNVFVRPLSSYQIHQVDQAQPPLLPIPTDPN